MTNLISSAPSSSISNVFTKSSSTSSVGSSGDPDWNSVTLLLPFDGNDGDTTTVDRSLFNHTISYFGNPQISTAQSKFGGSSMFFDGASYLRVDSALSAFTLTSLPFTIEMWLYPTVLGGTGSASDDFIGINRAIDGANVLTLGMPFARIDATERDYPDLELNKWQHYAYVFDGQNHRIFLDGNLHYELLNIFFGNTLSSCVLGIGAEFDGADGGSPGNYFNGYIDDLRITAGVQRYFNTFDIPTQAFPTNSTDDPNFNDVTLLLPLEGSDNDTFTTDLSTNATTVDFFSGAKITTLQSKFGNTSLFLDGIDDYIRVDNALSTHTDVSTPITIEMWVYPLSVPTAREFIGINDASDGTNRVLVATDDVWINNARYTYPSGNPFTIDSWQHLIYQYDGSNHTIYLDGQEIFSITNNTLAVSLNNCVFGIGAEFDAANGGSPGNYLPAYIDEIRVTVGSLRYIPGFTPPTQSLPTTNVTGDPYWNDVTLLLSFDDADGATSTTDSSTNNTSVSFFNTAQISTAQSKFGSSSLLLNGTTDYIRADGALSSHTELLTPFTIEMWLYPQSVATGTYYIGINAASSGTNIVLIGFDSFIVDGTNYTFTNPFTTNEWQFVQYTYDGYKHRLYRNGQLIVTSGSTPNTLSIPLNQCVFGIGAEFDNAGGGGPGNYYQGYIDEVRFTNGVARAPFIGNTPTEPFAVSAATTGVSATSSLRNLFVKRIQPVQIVTDGLVALYDAGDVSSYPGTGTTWYDISGSTTTYDGTLLTPSGPVYDSGNQGTIFFDGLDDYVNIGTTIDDEFNSTDEITVGAWFKLNSIVSKPAILTIGNAFNFFLPGSRLGPTQQLFWEVSSSWRGGNKTDWVLGQFYYLNWTIAADNTIKFYVDGQLDYTSSIVSNISAVTGGNLIGIAAAGEVASANVGIVEIYNRALNATEINQNFESRRSRYSI